MGLSPGQASWFTWTTSSGALTVSLGGRSIASLYFPALPVPVTCTANGNVFFITPSGTSQTIPVPSGTTSLTLSASAGSTIYVFATSYAYNPENSPPSGLYGNVNWIIPQPPAIGSGGTYTNNTGYLVLLSVGGTSATVTLNGTIIGVTNAIYQIPNGETVEVQYGFDLTILTATNLTHYYPLQVLTLPGPTTPYSVGGQPNGTFQSLFPTNYEAPVLGGTLTSDGSASVQLNNPGTSASGYGWIFSPDDVYAETGPWSVCFMFEDLGQYPSSLHSGYATLIAIAGGTSAVFPMIVGLYPGGAGPQYNTSYEVIDRITLNVLGTLPTYTAGVPHFMVITFNGTQLGISVDNGSPVNISQSSAGNNVYVCGDNNAQFPGRYAISKFAMFNTVLSSTVIQQYYIQLTASLAPQFGFFEVV